VLYKVLLSISIFMVSVHAQQNPLLSSQNSSVCATQTREVSGADKTLHVYRVPLLRYVLVWQRKLNAGLSTLLLDVRKSFSVRSALLLFSIAFAYGVVHALGPGHGKVIIGSYMLTQQYSLRLSWLVGGIFAGTHAGMAGGVYALLALAFHWGRTSLDAVSANVYKMSGFLVACIGLVLLYHAIRIKKEEGALSVSAGTKRSLAAVAFVSGLTPCPGTMLLLIFSHVAGVPVYGLISAVFLSIGMAVTITTIAALGKVVQKTIMSSKAILAAKTLRVVGAVIVFLVGCIMCAG